MIDWEELQEQLATRGNAIAAELAERELWPTFNRLFLLFPDEGPLRRELYPKHLDFLAAGAHHHERAFVAANRVGKSVAVCYEAVCHLIGWYPDWWRGHRFNRPIVAWICGEDTKAVRESLQEALLGQPGALGTGLIPRDRLERVVARSGVPDAVDAMQIRHANGGLSRVVFKAYEMGREAFQAAKVDVVVLDEEPPQPVYSESLTRTMSTVPGEPSGIVLCAFTPLKGLSAVVQSFMPGGARQEGDLGYNRWTTFATWDDVPHLSDDEKRSLAQSYAPHERDARTKGIPSLGAGAIYPISEDEVLCDPFEFPAWYRHAYGLDVGWNRTAAIWGAVDPEDDCLYLYSEHYRGQAEPAVHAAAIRSRGEWIPGVVDPAARGRGQADGEQLLGQYINLGLSGLTSANNAVEAGIYAVWSRLSMGKLKVFRTLQNFRQEYRIYRRDEKGKIVKEMDHLMDACRYLCMSGLDRAIQRPVEQWPGRPGMPRTVQSGFQSAYRPFEQAYGVVKQQERGTTWPGMGRLQR